MSQRFLLFALEKLPEKGNFLEINLASRWEGVKLPRASGKSPDFPGSSPDVPRSSPNFPGGRPLSLGSLTPSPDSQKLSLNYGDTGRPGGFQKFYVTVSLWRCFFMRGGSAENGQVASAGRAFEKSMT